MNLDATPESKEKETKKKLEAKIRKSSFKKGNLYKKNDYF